MHRFAKPISSSSRYRLMAARAHGLRAAPTVSEARLWTALSGSKLGVAFRRQIPVGGRFIADFLAPQLHLIVEVDGSIHERTRNADARREQKLQRLGYHVLRLDARLVLGNLDAAVALVRARLSEAPAHG